MKVSYLDRTTVIHSANSEKYCKLTNGYNIMEFKSENQKKEFLLVQKTASSEHET